MDQLWEKLSEQLIKAFPRYPPSIVVEKNWGDYDDAATTFAKYGSSWTCEEIFQNRSVIHFVNEQAFLFLLPRFISCCVRGSVIVSDVLDYVVSALTVKKDEQSQLFSISQKQALHAALSAIIDGRVLASSVPVEYHDKLSDLLTWLQETDSA